MKDTRILVVEDEILIGLDIVTVLEGAGFRTVEHVTTEREALHQIEAQHWDAAVADANLNGRSIECVGKALQRKAIPFVIVTGYARESLPEDLREVPLIAKPFAPFHLAKTVKELCGT